MGRSSLSLEAANLDALVEEGLELLQGGDYDPEDVLRLCRHERQRACANLLLYLDTAGFQEGLQRAALAYLHLLQRRAKLQDPDPYWFARSAGVPYLDALAANDRALAAEVAAQSTATHTRDMEDEDDFAYFVALAELAAPRPDPSRVQAALEAYERALRGAESPRLDALRAIRAGDADGFGAALGALLRAWRERVEEERSTGMADPYFANVEAHVCVEGLALVQLARWYGLATESEYPSLPGPALALEASAGRPDLWR